MRDPFILKRGFHVGIRSAFKDLSSVIFEQSTGKAKCVVELVVTFRPVLLALRDVINYYLLMSSWLPEQCEVMTFVSLEIWLLHTRRLERKAYYL